MKRLLLDVNVVLDVLLDRDPWVDSAAGIWALVETGGARGFIPAHGVTTIHYLLRKARGVAFADRATSDLLSVFGVARVDADVLKAALSLRFPDFEDAVCVAAGQAARCDLVITRDPAGFRDSPLPAASAGEALIRLTPPARPKPRRVD